MNRHAPLRVLLALSLTSALSAQSAMAVETYKDWAVACDNTRRCEAVGYQEKESDTPPVLLHLLREAGPATPVRATFSVQTEDEAPARPLTVRINKLVLRGVQPDKELTLEQTRSLLPALLDASAAKLTDGKTTWTLSLAGIKAALLKMDDLQGRIGTPGALVRKGGKPESSVLSPLPAPILRPAPLAPERKGDEKLLSPILKAIKSQDSECREGVPDADDAYPSITRLTDKTVLVMRLCSRAAYQVSYGMWIANDKPPYDPQPVSLPTETTEMGDYGMNAGFANGILTTFSKGRGIFDCGDRMSWLWTASGFELLEAQIGPLCRGFGGGGQMLRVWTADVRR